MSININVGQSFRFITEDRQWLQKIGFGAIGMLIPFVGAMTQVIETARNVAQGKSDPLPMWKMDETLGPRLMYGVYAFLISLIYAIPMIVIQIVFNILITMTSGSIAGGLIACLSAPVNLVVSIATGLVVLPALARYVQTGNWKAALEFQTVIKMLQKAPQPWLILLVVDILASLITLIGLIAFIIGVFITMAIGGAILGHALGQAAAQMGNAPRIEGTSQ
jgi:hypothetical protein